MTTNDTNRPSATSASASPPSSIRTLYNSIFSVPAPIRRLFDTFPLHTYPACERPLRSPRNRNRHVLYVFASARDADRGRPSLNPVCCRWQTYLHFSGAKFKIVSSSNHASPSGALPFLIPANGETPIISTGLEDWAATQESKANGDITTSRTKLRREKSSADSGPYFSLLQGPVRVAYLAALYLDQTTYESFTAPQYTHASRSSAVRYALSIPLRRFALSEILASSNRDGAEDVDAELDEEELASEAEDALRALSLKLGDSDWFDGCGMLDASVFGYTHVLLTILERRLTIGVLAQRLCRAVKARENLVRHRARILDRHYSSR